MEKKERFYTTEELIKLFNISRWTIYRAIKSGKLKVHKSGEDKRFNLFSESDVKSYIEMGG